MSDIEFKKLAKEMAGKQGNASSVLLLAVITLMAIIFIWATVTESRQRYFGGWQKPSRKPKIN